MAEVLARTTDVRAATAEVWQRVREWHSSPTTVDDETGRRRFAITAQAVATLEALTDPMDRHESAAIVHAVRPMIDAWRLNDAGRDLAVYAAVDRLRDAIRRLADLWPE